MFSIVTTEEAARAGLPDTYERWVRWDTDVSAPDLRMCERDRLNVVIVVPIEDRQKYLAQGFRMHKHGHIVDVLFWQYGCSFWG